MNIRAISLLYLVNSFFFIGAMDLVLSADKQTPDISSFLQLLRKNRQSKLADFLEKNPPTQDIAVFLKESLGSDEPALQAVSFFELKGAVSQDAATNSEAFRRMYHQLHSENKAVGVFILPRMVPHAKKSTLAPTGLANLGATCFLNADIQALLPAAHDIERALLTGGAAPNETRQLLMNLFKHMEKAPLTTFEKHAQEKVLAQKSGKHQCNGEFMDRLFDSMLTSIEEDEVAPELTDIFATEFLVKRHKTAPKLKPLATLFAVEETKALMNHGDLLEKADFKKENPGTALHLSIKKGSLIDILAHHFSLEQFAASEKPRNEKTKGLYDLQQRKLIKTGEYLVIHIKRVIDYDSKTERGIHSTEPTPFPLAHLDLKDHFIDAHANPGQYELESVVMHQGTADLGHYITYSKRANPEGNEAWHLLNDSASPKLISDMEMMRIALSGNNGSFLPTTFVYRKSDKPALSESNSEDEIDSPRHARIILCTVASNKDGGVDIQEKIFSDNADDKIDTETNDQREILIGILKSAPHAMPVQSLTPPTQNSTLTNSTSQAPKLIWSKPENILIPIVLLLVAIVFGKEDTPTEKAEKEKEKEAKKKREQNLRDRKPMGAVILDPSETPQPA